MHCYTPSGTTHWPCCWVVAASVACHSLAHSAGRGRWAGLRGCESSRGVPEDRRSCCSCALWGGVVVLWFVGWLVVRIDACEQDKSEAVRAAAALAVPALVTHSSGLTSVAPEALIVPCVKVGTMVLVLMLCAAHTLCAGSVRRICPSSQRVCRCVGVGSGVRGRLAQRQPGLCGRSIRSRTCRACSSDRGRGWRWRRRRWRRWQRRFRRTIWSCCQVSSKVISCQGTFCGHWEAKSAHRWPEKCVHASHHARSRLWVRLQF